MGRVAAFQKAASYAAEQWQASGGFPSIARREATMGLIEISVVLACASAFGFYISAKES